MLIKQTAWLLVKSIIIMGLVSASLIYLADKPDGQITVTQHFANIVFW